MNRSVLAIGAHPDDIELGCGGAILQHAAAGDRVTMLVMTKGEVGPGRVADRVREQEHSCALLGASDLVWGNIPDCKVSLYELEVVHTIEDAIREHRADIIYTHSLSDSHQDHRSVAAATTGAARKCGTILSYDAPSSLNFRPSVFVDVASVMDKKIEALLCHASQVAASEMVDDHRVRAQATYRGHEARLLAAEAFEPVRATWSIA
jgi:LmbE family N-acetylglucosaminyl deacetylase